MSKENLELQWVESLARTLAEHKLHKLELETEDVSVVMLAKSRVHTSSAVTIAPPENIEDVQEADVVLIRSKDVGIFRASDRLQSGAEIEKGQKIGRVEAVSVEHDLISDYAGTLVEMLVFDGDPVEYGQPLMVLSEREG